MYKYTENIVMSTLPRGSYYVYLLQVETSKQHYKELYIFYSYTITPNKCICVDEH